MFDNAALLTTSGLGAVVGQLARLDGAVGDAERIDQIRLLEELKSAVGAAQAKVAAAFAPSQRRAQTKAGVPAGELGRGIAAQVGLARRESPFRARRYVGWADVLVRELPHTFAALQRGEITEWQAMIVARETGWLSAEHRARVDRELAAGLETWGDRQVEAEAKRWAYRLDPHRSAGDSRTMGQIMADTLVERVTGQARAGQVPVTVDLVLTDRTLFGSDVSGEADEPAHLVGFGTIPAHLAREMVHADPETRVWLRRLYTRCGRLVAMDRKARFFGHRQREILVLRDQTCRTPWCDAPIRHADHVVPVEAGGPTSIDNGQGLCEACNHAKTAPGWQAWAAPTGAGDTVVTTTPTGHTYRSRAPDPVGPPRGFRVDLWFREIEHRLAA